jgi:RNA polymerase sigma factor (sigma-70 family)
MYRPLRTESLEKAGRGGEKTAFVTLDVTHAERQPGRRKIAICGNRPGLSVTRRPGLADTAPGGTDAAAVQVTAWPAAARSDRPSRAQIEPAALALLARHSAGLLATARRYSASPEDAEDAYQRGVEILLTKAPSAREDELLPWLKTVVKHEAFAVGKARGRAQVGAAAADEPDPAAWTDERAERYEQLRVGAEAMANLKPQEIRCLLLRAEGLSYKEICAATGWTYTKVNRCITEGRRAFLKRVASIESGAECERLAPLISKLADGEATAAELRTVRPHLRGCLACKATLRQYRAAPTRLAGLVPPVVALGAPGGGTTGFVMRVAQALHERFAGLADAAGASKAAAVAASAALLAGGGAAGVRAIDDQPRQIVEAASAHAEDEGQPAASAVAAATRVAASFAATSAPDPAPDPATPPTSASPRRADHAPAGPDAHAPEFDPGTAVAVVHPESTPGPSATVPTDDKSATPAERPEFGP